MKISKPSAPTMHEYLLYYGEEWVKKHFEMTSNQIDDLLYGSKLPTESQQKKIIDRARKEDCDRKAYMLSMYMNDHFIWDKPQKNHIRCQNAEDKEMPNLSHDFWKDWCSIYLHLMSKDMGYHKNRNMNHGWQHGERVINKTTSCTSDDDISNRMLRMLEAGKIESWYYTLMSLKSAHEKNIEGHGFYDESFIDNTIDVTISSLKDYVSKNSLNIELFENY